MCKGISRHEGDTFWASSWYWHLKARVKVRSHMRGRRRAENWLEQKSLHAFTHTRSRSGGGAGAKSAPQQMGPTPNFPCPLRNRALQTIFVLKKWQIRPSPHRVYMCEHTHPTRAAVAERNVKIRPPPLRNRPAHV